MMNDTQLHNNEHAKPLKLPVSVIPVVSETDEDVDVQLTTALAVVICDGNSTRNRPMMNGPMVAPNDHMACTACKAGSL